MPTTRVSFSVIDIIESIRPGEGFAARTGFELMGEIEPIAQTVGSGLQVRYTDVRTRQAFFDRLRWIAQDAKARQRWPILHIEVHGGQAGIEVTSGEVISWQEMRAALTEVNQITRLNLLVVLAACKGAHLVQILQPHDRAPFRALIGPRREISAGELLVACTAFYRAIFGGQSGRDAYVAMNLAVLAGDDPFDLSIAERAFRQVAANYFSKENSGSAARAEQQKNFVDRLETLPTHEMRVTALNNYQMRIADPLWQYEFMRDRFFFGDLDPEIPKSFEGISFEECLADAALIDARNDSSPSAA